MPPGVDWAGLATRALALSALVVLAHMVLARPAAPVSAGTLRSSHPARWYGYARLRARVALPGPQDVVGAGRQLRAQVAGSGRPGRSFALWLPAVPWLLAAALSLLLASTPRWMPRRLLLTAGSSATVVVAMVGPAGCWSLLSGVIAGDADFGGMAGWVYGLVYGSWFLWAFAAGAATRAYQLRSGSRTTGPRRRQRVAGGKMASVSARSPSLRGALETTSSAPPKVISTRSCASPCATDGSRPLRGSRR